MANDSSLSFTVRLRAALLGIAFGVLAIIAAVALGLLIVTGPFHTALASLA